MEIKRWTVVFAVFATVLILSLSDILLHFVVSGKHALSSTGALITSVMLVVGLIGVSVSIKKLEEGRYMALLFVVLLPLFFAYRLFSATLLGTEATPLIIGCITVSIALSVALIIAFRKTISETWGTKRD